MEILVFIDHSSLQAFSSEDALLYYMGRESLPYSHPEEIYDFLHYLLESYDAEQQTAKISFILNEVEYDLAQVLDQHTDLPPYVLYRLSECLPHLCRKLSLVLEEPVLVSFQEQTWLVNKRKAIPANKQEDCAHMLTAPSLAKVFFSPDEFDRTVALAAQGDSKALYTLACHYLEGEIVEANTAKAIDMLTALSQQGFVQAQITLAKLCVTNNMPLPCAIDLSLLHTAAASGDVEAQYVLGALYAQEGQQEQAAHYYTQAAYQDHAEAQAQLGMLYAEEKIEVPNTPLTLVCYQQAAKHGHAQAQYKLAQKYENGAGVTANKTRAIEYYKKAASQGHQQAQKTLERLNAATHRPKPTAMGNATLSLTELYTLSLQGDACAQYQIGQRYETGNGIKKNVRLAKDYYQKAAAQGFLAAQTALRRILRSQH